MALSIKLHESIESSKAADGLEAAERIFTTRRSQAHAIQGVGKTRQSLFKKYLQIIRI